MLTGINPAPTPVHAGGWSPSAALAALATNFRVRRREKGLLKGLRTTLAAGRALGYWRLHVELFALAIYARYIVVSEDGHALAHLSHEHYLATALDCRQRIACALTHYAREHACYVEAYSQAVYAGQGIVLWATEVDGVRYRLLLRDSKELRHEGALTVRFEGDGQYLCEMAYSWVDPGIFGGAIETPSLFVTRNQSAQARAPELGRFREHFPQNSPSYFCLAAVLGIAQANGVGAIACIRHDAQLAFEPRLAGSFKSSYCDFWSKFGAVALPTTAWVMTVPAPLAHIGELAAKHRKRALDRRRHWADITQSSVAALAVYHRRREDSGPPLAV